MSDRASLILDELAGGERLTTDEIVESTGLERSAVSAELSALKNAGRAISGRGGWTLTDAAPAAPRRHEAPEPTSDPGRREKAKKRMAKVRAKRKEAPTTQTAKTPPAPSPPPTAPTITNATRRPTFCVSTSRRAKRSACSTPTCRG